MGHPHRSSWGELVPGVGLFLVPRLIREKLASPTYFLMDFSWKALKLLKYPLFLQTLISAFSLHLRKGEYAATEIPMKQEKS